VLAGRAVEVGRGDGREPSVLIASELASTVEILRIAQDDKGDGWAQVKGLDGGDVSSALDITGEGFDLTGRGRIWRGRGGRSSLDGTGCIDGRGEGLR
jgi:hypothetical protein